MIKDLIKGIKDKMLGTLTKESSKEQIDFVNGIITELDSVDGEAETLIKEKQDVTELYVKAMKGSGTATEVDDGADGGSKPKTFEECLDEELAKGSK